VRACLGDRDPVHTNGLVGCVNLIAAANVRIAKERTAFAHARGVSVIVSTVKKSQTRTLVACWRRKSRQPRPTRRGTGVKPAAGESGETKLDRRAAT
jgi:hypothetical protein